MTAAGQIYMKEQASDYQVLYLKNISIVYQQQSIQEPYMIIYDKSMKRLHLGNTVSVSGKLSFYEEESNPGCFSQKKYYRIQKIAAYMWSGQLECTSKERFPIRDWLSELRNAWKKHLLHYEGEDDQGILSAILLGDKKQIDTETRELYQVNGIAHVMAISGLHLSFIGIGMYKFIRRITGSYAIGGACGILFLVLYILMIGFTVSVVRALTMFLFRVGADMSGRHYDATTAFSAAAVVVLLWRPLSLYDGGFWLSFGAVFAILAVVPVLQKGIFARTSCKVHSAIVQRGNRKMNIQSLWEQNADEITLAVYLKTIRGYIWKGIVQGLTAGIGIHLVIFPVLLYYFFEIPPYSFIMNLFVIPLMSVLLFMGMAGSLFSVCFSPLSGICFWICSGILRLYKISCNLALALPGARLVIGKPKMWQIVIYYGILAVVLLLLWEKGRRMEQVYAIYSKADNRREIGGRKTGFPQYADSELSRDLRRKEVRLGRFALMLGIAGIIILTNRWGERGKLTAVVLDVGQGDGIFMRGPEGGTYLVDGGSSDVKKAGQYRIEPFLKSQGVGMIDYVLISHGDSDHMNGIEELIERQDIGVRIGTLVLPVKEVWDEALEGIAEKAKEYGIRVVVIEPGQSIKEGNMAVTCIQPGNVVKETESAASGQEGRELETEGTELEPGNAASMVLAVRYGEFDMLLTGDVEGEGEERLTKQLEEQYRDCTWEILKVAHHGSKNSSSEEFLRQARPAYALISAGRENRYGHPHQETVERLTDAGSKIYSTQGNGAVIVEVEDGETMKIKNY